MLDFNMILKSNSISEFFSHFKIKEDVLETALFEFSLYMDKFSEVAHKDGLIDDPKTLSEEEKSSLASYLWDCTKWKAFKDPITGTLWFEGTFSISSKDGFKNVMDKYYFGFERSEWSLKGLGER